MRFLKPIIFLLMALVLTACPYPIGGGYDYPNGELPAYPVNLEAFNSEYDDYNMSAPSLGMLFPFCFSTNRPGGSGGYDLYYSKFEEGAWGEPVNFGPDINSPADDYRVILLDPYVDSERDMMIFSSNREGGKGALTCTLWES